MEYKIGSKVQSAGRYYYVVKRIPEGDRTFPFNNGRVSKRYVLLDAVTGSDVEWFDGVFRKIGPNTRSPTPPKYVKDRFFQFTGRNINAPLQENRNRKTAMLEQLRYLPPSETNSTLQNTQRAMLTELNPSFQERPRPKFPGGIEYQLMKEQFNAHKTRKGRKSRKVSRKTRKQSRKNRN